MAKVLTGRRLRAILRITPQKRPRGQEPTQTTSQQGGTEFSHHAGADYSCSLSPLRVQDEQ